MLKYLRQLAGESMVYGIPAVVQRFLGFLLVPIYTRIFNPADYGVMSLITTTMAAVAIFAVLALDNSAHRWFWDTEDTADRKTTLATWAWCQIVVSAVLAVGVFAFAGWLGKAIVGRADAPGYFRLTALTLPLGVMGAVVTNWFRMQRRAWATVFYAIGTSLFTTGTSVLLVVVLHRGLRGVYESQVMSLAVGTLIAVALMGDWLNPRYFRWHRLIEMLRFGLPLIPAALAFWIVSFSDRYFVKMYTNTAEVGLYQVGSSLAAVLALITGAFQQSWGPFALSIHKREDARQVYASVFLAYVWLTSALSVALALVAPSALRIIATDRFVGASSVVGILAFSYVAIGLGYIATIGLAVVKTTGPTGAAITVAAIVNIGLNILLVPHMGKVGSAVATLISQACVPVYVFYRSQKYYPIPYRFWSAAGVFVLSLFVVVLGTHCRLGNAWADVGAKLALVSLFLPALLVLRIITPNQAQRLLRARKLSGV